MIGTLAQLMTIPVLGQHRDQKAWMSLHGSESESSLLGVVTCRCGRAEETRKHLFGILAQWAVMAASCSG